MKPLPLHIRFSGFTFHAFHFFGITGFIIGNLLGILLAYSLGLNIFVVMLMGAVGAAIFFLLALASRLFTGEESIVYYHHEIAILLACTLVLSLIRADILPYLDITLLGIGVFLAFGRVGCYAVGCCHGRPYKYGVRYGQQHVDAGFTWYYKDVPLLPVQLIESAYVFINVIIGIVLLLAHAAPGTVLVVYTVIYGLMRYILEFLRGDPDRPTWFGLSEAQWTTMILVAVTYIMSLIGWLPQYGWHLVILIAIVLISAWVIVQYRTRAGYFIFSPSHIRQIAKALDRLDERDSGVSGDNTVPVKILRTNKGFRLSAGEYWENDNQIKHYTISFQNEMVLRKQLVEKLAVLINQLKERKDGFHIREMDSGVFHILFTKSPSFVKTSQ